MFFSYVLLSMWSLYLNSVTYSVSLDFGLLFFSPLKVNFMLNPPAYRVCFWFQIPANYNNKQLPLSMKTHKPLYSTSLTQSRDSDSVASHRNENSLCSYCIPTSFFACTQRLSNACSKKMWQKTNIYNFIYLTFAVTCTLLFIHFDCLIM